MERLTSKMRQRLAFAIAPECTVWKRHRVPSNNNGRCVNCACGFNFRSLRWLT